MRRRPRIALAAENGIAFTLTGLGDPVQLPAFRATANYFDVLGVRPIRGRNFLPQEEEGADVAMVTENFWRKRLGGDPSESLALSAVEWVETSLTALQTSTDNIERFLDSARNDSS